ncbi:MAG TPA: molybdate ABC transporter substrate-binding protein [Ilumatobacteraceae bacterium]|nr:molybdate ABC transporter substrate-binding protein [Ilumatobacteraceae bacterium]
MMCTSARLVISTVALLGVVAASCGSDSNSGSTVALTTPVAPPATEAPTTEAPTTVPAATGDVVVFAASSLTEAFTEMGTAFKVDNPDANVTFNFAGSGDLVTQITQGAPADIFVSADDKNMKKMTDAGENVGEPVSIAKNTMEIIVEKGNPKGITSVADLARSDLIVVLCAETVPCGSSAAAVLKNAAVTASPKSLEDKVKGVVTKVSAGEADAGIVFVTDVNAAKDSADGVEIPADINVINNYPMVLTKEATNPTAAQAFADYVASDAGQAILGKYGFLPA